MDPIVIPLSLVCLLFLCLPLRAQESLHKNMWEMTGKCAGSRMKRSPGQSPVSIYIQFIPHSPQAEDFQAVKRILRNLTFPSAEPEIEITNIMTTTECRQRGNDLRCTCHPGFLLDITKCRENPLCSTSTEMDSYCKCSQWTPSTAYCEEPPANPGNITLLSGAVGAGSHVLLKFSSTGDVTNIRWFLINTFMNQVMEIHNGTKASIVTSNKDSVLSIKEIPRSWEGQYICTFIYKNLQWQAGYTIKFPLRPQDITRNPTQVSIRNNATGFRGITLECCIWDDGQSYNVFWEPGKTTAVVGRKNGQLCYSMSIQRIPEADTSYQCVFQDNSTRAVKAEVKVVVIKDKDTFCLEDGYDLSWKAAKAGQVAEILCPQGKQGSITRRCGTDGHWEDPEPNCMDTKLLLLLEQTQWLREGLGVPERDIPWMIQGLRNYTMEKNQYVNTSRDIVTVVDTIKTISFTATENNLHFNFSIMSVFVAVCSHILDYDTEPLWLDARAEDPYLGAMFLQSIENMTRLLEPSGESFTLTEPNVDLNIFFLSNYSFIYYNITFDIYPRVNVYIKSVQLQELVTRGNLTVASIVLKNLARILPNHYDEDLEGAGQTVKNLILINTIMMNNEIVRQVGVDVIFDHVDELNETRRGYAQCVFWDYRLFDGVGGWSSEGCLSYPEENSTKCSCNHVSSFSVLKYGGSSSRRLKNFTSVLLSRIGVTISIICLIVCLVVYIVMRNSIVRNKISFFRHMSVVNITLSLLIADSWYLASSFIKKRQYNRFCIAAAFFEHLFYLATFFWMLFEGLILFHQMIFVFHQLIKRAVIPTMVTIGYVCPLLISIVTLAVYYPQRTYIEEEACFLNEENGVIHTFSIPVIIIIVVNIIILLVVVLKLLRTSASERPEGEDKEALIEILKSLLFLTPTFGITWILGTVLPLICSVHPFFHHFFTILNSFHGVFILIFDCLMNKKVRGVLSRKVHSYSCPEIPSVVWLWKRRGKNSYSMDQRNIEESMERYKTV